MTQQNLNNYSAMLKSDMQIPCETQVTKFNPFQKWRCGWPIKNGPTSQSWQNIDSRPYSIFSIYIIHDIHVSKISTVGGYRYFANSEIKTYFLIGLYITILVINSKISMNKYSIFSIQKSKKIIRYFRHERSSSALILSILKSISKHSIFGFYIIDSNKIKKYVIRSTRNIRYLNFKMSILSILIGNY